jgi:hypothetical protein
MSPTARLLTSLKPITPQFSDRYVNTLVVPGASHLRDGRNCQDYATTASCNEGTVIVVSDGASNYRDDRGHKNASHNEAGAILVGELAQAAALEGLRAKLSPDAIADLVALRIHTGLHPLWALMEGRGLLALGATMVLGLVTDHYTRIWLSGDGAFGVYLSQAASLDSLTGTSLIDTQRAGLVSICRSHHTPHLERTVTTAARRSVEDVRRTMTLALGIDQPVIGAWVASDGLADEPVVQRMVQAAPQTSRGRLADALTRPPQSDDLAVAWVCDRFPDLTAEVSDAS